MISFHNVTKRFGPHLVLDQITFEIKPKEFVVLKGTSGAGKSTVVALLIGAEKPDHGSVEMDGMFVNEMDDDTLQLYRRKIGVVFQDYKLLPKKTVFENVAFAMEVCGEPNDVIHQRVPEVLEKVGLLRFQDKFPEQLSGGEKQRLAIARALVHKPRLIIADEPTGNLDEDNVRGIVDVLKKLHEEGVTVLMTTHDPLVQELAPGRSLLLQDGKII
ncbi:ATP-binding cassette domain-containing protein [Patescibacteria group bacterium]|nr:ATP-binding cassette domain-containing protein [Patescibacteria group bacterium]MBU1683452.1 ATP-binding cassette domain-containing protein [Patescibacteria group bacterium]MBU1934823.1 ATP-binding cassette domain-containing protein [Patescibacteria group bacterium]